MLTNISLLAATILSAYQVPRSRTSLTDCSILPPETFAVPRSHSSLPDYSTPPRPLQTFAVPRSHSSLTDYSNLSPRKNSLPLNYYQTVSYPQPMPQNIAVSRRQNLQYTPTLRTAPSFRTPTRSQNLKVMSLNLLNWPTDLPGRDGALEDLLTRNNIDVLLTQEDWRPDPSFVTAHQIQAVYQSLTRAGFELVSRCEAEEVIPFKESETTDLPYEKQGHLENRVYLRTRGDKDIQLKAAWGINLPNTKELVPRCAAMAKIRFQEKDWIFASAHLSGGSYDDKELKDTFPALKDAQLEATFGGMMEMSAGGEYFVLGADTNAYVPNHVEVCQKYYAMNNLKLTGEKLQSFYAYQTIPDVVNYKGSSLNLVKTDIEKESIDCAPDGSAKFGGVVDHFFVSNNLADRASASVLVGEGFTGKGRDANLKISDHNPILLTT